MSRQVDPNTVDIAVAVTLLYSRLPDLDSKFFQSIQNAYSKQYEVSPRETYHILSGANVDLCETSWKFVLIATTNEHLVTSFRQGMYADGESIPDNDPDDLSDRN
jgi:hypothetical protein